MSRKPIVGRRPARSFVQWKLTRFLADTPTVRSAVSVIVAADVAIVIVAAVAMRIVDAQDFPNIWRSLWWAVQTATTVGYGDVTPRTVAGRIIAAAVMLEGIGFLAVITASIASTFFARAQRERGDDAERWHHVEARFDDVEHRLEAIARVLDGSPPSHDAPFPGPRLDRDQTP
jgi:voltage-gated potassium channel Kch